MSTYPLQLGSPLPLIEAHDALLVDLDGVVYVGPHQVPYAVESLTESLAQGVHVAYVTNNASRPPEVVAEHLAEFGLPVLPHDVVTSAQAGARLIAERIPAGAPILAIGGPGVGRALTDRGYLPVSSVEQRPLGVLQGYGPDVSWRDLAQASYAVANGALHVATNRDRTIPTPQGRAPGNGMLVAAVVEATGIEPLVAGKPESALMLESIERVGAQRSLTIGDRLDTDIEAACRLGLPSLLVLTGVTGVRELLAAPAHSRPTWVAADLRGLYCEHPPVVGGDGWAQCGKASVSLKHGHLAVESHGSHIDQLRAAAVVAWWASDAGEPCDVSQAAHSLWPGGSVEA